nr:ATP-binding protein [Negativicutes bacterium]
MSQEVRIQVLDELTANQIAAGEVVERPANAVKEMIENSLDAGAKRIRVEIRGGGRKLIKVSDDGSGMNPSELPLAILRHATSKLRKIDDLDTLHSLGFRGEALASIAAVSRIILTSRQAGSPLGQVLEVKGGKEVRNEPCGAEVGTTIEVQELFFNMPAREKFMKADSAEHRAISEMMTRFALARPDVSFLLEVEGKRSLFTQGNLSLLDAAGSIFGAQVGSELLPVNREDHLGSARGLIGKPTLVKSSRSHQF